MRCSDKIMNQEGDTPEVDQILMVSGFVCPESSCTLSKEVRRGMVIRSRDGLEVGKVAAVVLDRFDRKATHILLSRLPEECGYWLVPASSVAQVDAERVQLSIPGSAIDTLPPWHST